MVLPSDFTSSFLHFFLFIGLVMNLVSKGWPIQPQFLIPGVNDTWNEFQKSSRGKTVTSNDWKTARAVLHEEFKQYLATGGVPLNSCCNETFRCALAFNR